MSGVLRAAAAIAAAGDHPLAVLDVDLTLVDNAPRTRAIFADWAARLIGRWDGAEAALARAPTMPIVFSAEANLRALGVDDEALLREGLAAWWEGFFAPRYAALDVPLPGAVAAVTALARAEVTVVYLTARPASLGGATVSRLRELGFPVATAGTVLIMKDTPLGRPGSPSEEGDGAFKARALRWIGRLGRPALCAENEPGHANAMREAFPASLVTLVRTRHSPGAPDLHPAVVTVDDLREVL